MIFPTNNDSIAQAVHILRMGGVIAFPTETVYGLGGDLYDPDVMEEIYRIKGREKSNPLSVLIGDLSQWETLVESIPPEALKLAERFWPGPLTIVLPVNDGISPTLTAGTGKIGVRMPDHRVPQALIHHFGKPIIGTSANVSGQPSPISATEVEQALGDRIPLILDDGESAGKQASTVVEIVQAHRLYKQKP